MAGMAMAMLGGGPMLSAEETKRMLREGRMPGAPPPAAEQPPQGPAPDASPATEPRRGGRGPSEKQVHYFRCSAALTLLDLRVPDCGEATQARGTRRTPQDAALADGDPVCVRAPRGGLAARFINKAHGWLTDGFRARGVAVATYEDEGDVCCRFTAGDGPLTEGAARELAAGLEAELQRSAAADDIGWCEMVGAIVASLKDLLLSFHVADAPPPADEWELGVRPNFDKKQLAAVEPQPIVPSGDPSMAQYEYTFSAGGTQLLYPQPRLFTEDHWKLWEHQSPFGTGRRLLDQTYAMMTWIPHEVLHCVQDAAMGAVGTGGRSPISSWQCEYCVCFGQALLGAALVAEQRKLGVAKRTLPLPSHFVEESMLWLEAVVRRCSPDEALGWARGWLRDRAQGSPIPGGCPDPTGWMVDHHCEYLGLLGTVVLDAFPKWQALVERDEQTTSYWAELVKYINRLLCTESDAAAAAVADSLRVAEP
eukprot:TRINITY_DN65075_c0_g1_i1.p1 TRINITY_DN65075_c0_g1~~TRINITY_DN65075_c0_g1_i1.p1  ORF type:complete len:503 (+),score=188.31 TRINITY_DN65075_c0_g1_i1:71-1510(+)